MRWLALATLLGCAATVQWHSALWWWDQVGPSGVAWSLVLELVALWFWYHPGGGMRFAGAVASVVVLAGPLHHVAAPLWQETAAAEAQRTTAAAQLDSVRRQIEAQRDTLAGYRQRSAERTGWRDVQERASQRLAELRERERRLLARRAQLADDGTVALSLVTLLQAVALLLMQGGTITSVTHLSAAHRGALSGALQPMQQGAAAPQTAAAPPAHQPAAATEADYRPELSRRLHRYMQRHGLAQPQVAEQAGIARSEVGNVLRHDHLVAEGRRTASRNTFEAVATYLQQEEAA